jgi:hypothetical protein
VESWLVELNPNPQQKEDIRSLAHPTQDAARVEPFVNLDLVEMNLVSFLVHCLNAVNLILSLLMKGAIVELLEDLSTREMKYRLLI